MRMSTVVSICLMIAGGAFAQNSRSFVSVVGNDLNNCTIFTQCRTFTRALSVTNPGGEIIAITTGGYAPFFIGQAVTVTAAPGAYVSITSAGDGIDIAPGPSDRVVVRGIHITLGPGSGVGIGAMAYGSLVIEDCDVTGGSDGIKIVGSKSPAILRGTVARGFSGSGYQISGHATLIGCRAERGAGTGLNVSEGNVDGVVSAVDFFAVGNQIGAAVISTGAGHAVELNLDHAVITDNTQDGVAAIALSPGSATVRVTRSTVTNNGAYGFNQAGTATFASMNDNFVAGNRTADTSGTISAIAVH